MINALEDKMAAAVERIEQRMENIVHVPSIANSACTGMVSGNVRLFVSYPTA